MPDEHLPDHLRSANLRRRSSDGQIDLLATYLQRFDSAQTRRAYQNDIAQFFGLEHVTLDDAREVSFLHVNKFIEELEADGLKASTIQRKISALRGFFKWLEALEVIERDPANPELRRRVKRSSRQDRKIHYLSEDEAKQLLDATAEAGEAAMRDRALLLTLLHCVLRRSEAAAMDVEHIRPLGRHWILDLPQAKGGTDQFVKMPDRVVEAIEGMKSHYGITEGALWRSFSNQNRGERLSPDAIYEIVRRTAKEAGLPDGVGAHTLRHTGCTLAIESGASVHQVKTHARHKNLETTMLYVHQREKLSDSAADYIELGEESDEDE